MADSASATATSAVSSTVSAVSESVSASASGGHGLSLGNSSTFSIIGICLAVGSGLFIGASFVIKKKGLIHATNKYGNQAGEGHGYLKSWLWWTGMIMMIVGEILNFVAYAFTVAILVTPMGSVSVVVAAILSHFILKECLTFFGWIGCTLCILGSVILALNAPKEQSVRTIDEFMHYFISPGFLVWMSLVFAASLVVVFYVCPRWGRINMMPYISVCSLVGGISVSCTQGLGSAIVTSFQGDSQIKHWFFWFLLIFVIVTLLIEINYLNKALELFNTSMVVPVYFCYFTSATMITSFILYRGLKAPAVNLVTMVMGFLVICLGITLLQMSKVDPEKLQGLDRRSTLLLRASREKTEADEKGDVTAAEEPGMDALRGGFGAVGSIIRARSVSRRMSAASSAGLSARGSTRNYGQQSNLNTHGLAHLPRYQLTDNPMPEDYDRAHLSPGEYRSPSSPMPGTPSQPLNPKRSASALTFDDSDVVHKYGYGRSDGQTEAIHAVLAHEDVREGSAYSPSIVASPAREKPFLTLYDEDRARDSKTSFLQLFDTFTHSVNPQPTSPITGTTPHRFPPLHLLPGRSVSGGGGGSGDDQVRGGAHRGVRDYPHLPKTEEAVEREERAGLVAGADSASHQSHESDGEDTYGRRVREDDESTLHLDYDLNALRNSLDYPTSSPRTPIAAMSPLGRPDSPRRPMGPR